jgi:hypothetical protein
MTKEYPACAKDIPAEALWCTVMCVEDSSENRLKKMTDYKNGDQISIKISLKSVVPFIHLLLNLFLKEICWLSNSYKCKKLKFKR